MGGNGKSNEFDVIIVGGGATGAGTAWWSVSISPPALRDVITDCCIAVRVML